VCVEATESFAVYWIIVSSRNIKQLLHWFQRAVAKG
jgi:hypothetical protein